MDSERGHNKLVRVSSANELDFFVCSSGCVLFPFGQGELPFHRSLSHVHIAVVDGVHSVVVVDPRKSGGEHTTVGTTGSAWRRLPVNLAASQVGDVGQRWSLRLSPPSTLLLWRDASRVQRLRTPVASNGAKQTNTCATLFAPSALCIIVNINTTLGNV